VEQPKPKRALGQRGGGQDTILGNSCVPSLLTKRRGKKEIERKGFRGAWSGKTPGFKEKRKKNFRLGDRR